MIKPIDLDRAYRLLNIGATTLVSAAHEGDADIMAAAWAQCGISRIHLCSSSVRIRFGSFFCSAEISTSAIGLNSTTLFEIAMR